MNPKRKQRLLIVLGLVSGLGIAIGLIMFALSQNINLFFTPTQIAKGEAPSAQMIRVGGMVADGTVDRDPQSLKVAFDVTDFDHKVRVTYEGILPDLFREGRVSWCRVAFVQGNSLQVKSLPSTTKITCHLR